MAPQRGYRKDPGNELCQCEIAFRALLTCKDSTPESWSPPV